MSEFLGHFVDILLFTLWIMIFVAFVFLVVRIIGDIFRDSGLGFIGKVFWLFFVIVLPVLGSLVYLIVRGAGMSRRELEQAQRVRDAQVEYARGLVGEAGGPVAEIKAASELLDRGAITQDEFNSLKAKALGK